MGKRLCSTLMAGLLLLTGCMGPELTVLGTIDESKMIEAIQQNTRNFAKRQLTWFRNHPFDYWIDLGS